MLTIDDFRVELANQLKAAQSKNAVFVDVNSAELHRALGNYPDPSNHRMPTCCEAMYAAMAADDIVLRRPPKGKGASLTIRYKLPR